MAQETVQVISNLLNDVKFYRYQVIEKTDKFLDRRSFAPTVIKGINTYTKETNLKLNLAVTTISAEDWEFIKNTYAENPEIKMGYIYVDKPVKSENINLDYLVNKSSSTLNTNYGNEPIKINNLNGGVNELSSNRI